MKYLSGFILCCTMFFAANAKDTAQKHWGINFSTGIYPSIRAYYYLSEPPKFMAYLPYYKYPGLFTPSLTYTSGKHIFGIGPRILAQYKRNQQFSTQFFYDYIKTRPGKKYNHTFGIDNIYTYVFNKGNSTSNGQKVSYTSTSHQFLLHATVGLRREWKNNFYFNIYTGMGVALEKYVIQYDTENFPAFTKYNRNNGFLHKPYLNTLLKVGVGYNFVRK